MRTEAKKFFLFLVITLFNLNMLFADGSPQPPSPPNNGLPPPDPLPIDHAILVLLILALLLGFYAISKRVQIIQK